MIPIAYLVRPLHSLTNSLLIGVSIKSFKINITS